jgi:hypothetical protein
MSTEIVRAENTAIMASEPTFFMPIVDVQQAMQRRQLVEAFAKNVMIDGTDYGAIPGTDGKKKTLLKPGAEKLTSFFGMIPDFTVMHSVLDFDGTGEGNGESLIYYRVRCELNRGGVKVGSGDASCSSRESKYRWRNAARTCPQCGQPAIIKGKAEYGGGWLCFKKNGGCGAKFNDGDVAIEGQATGRIPNPDIADLDNTILKMAEKRALVAATLIATNVSDFFTQDMEDFADVTVVARVAHSEPEDVQFERPAPKPAPKPAKAQPKQPEADDAYDRTFKRMHATGKEVMGEAWRNGDGKELLKHVTGKESTKDLSVDEMLKVIEALEAMRVDDDNADAQPSLIDAPAKYN